MKSLFGDETWIAWIVATATAAITLATYSHSTFKTIRQDEIDQEKAAQVYERQLNLIDKRLERIEDKLDAIPRR